ncbi:putative methyltransferase C9orf114 homolog [Rosa chinensis]|uniref:putative methyltransferase C9orf114 homolog n=1 Tax=Rosa chinensis TaxID=74649 RepID=UPI000D0959BD|nr:putative methyltransferase C9orf114 homolog [Rosa chinensis]
MSRLSGKTTSSTLSAQQNPLDSSIALREIRVRIGARSSLIQTHLQFKASRPGDIDEREVVTPDVMTKYFIGVTLKERSPDGVWTLVDVGLSKNVVVDQVLDPGTRVTVAMGDSWNLDTDISRQVVSSSKPREEAGMYWGYKVHYASNITSVMIECPYEGGYDHLIGTSEHGQIINSSDLTIPTFRCKPLLPVMLEISYKLCEQFYDLGNAKNVREVFDI